MDATRDVELGFLARIADSIDELAAALAHPRGSGPPIRHAPVRVVATAPGTFTIVEATTRRLVVVGVLLLNREAVDVQFWAGANRLGGTMPLALNGGFGEGFKSRDVPVFPSFRGEELAVEVSAATTLGGVLAYFED